MLGNILSTGEQVLILVVLLAVGFLCGKIRIFNDQSISHLSAFALKIVGPCAIVESFCRQFDSAMLRAMGIVALLAFAAHALYAAFAYVCIRGGKEPTRRVLRYGTVFANCGYMGLPLQQVLFGADGVFYGATWIGVYNLVAWSFGLVLMSGDRRQISFKKLLLNPGILAVLTGIAVGATSILVPEVEYEFQKDIIDRMQFTQMTGKKHFIVVVAEGIGGVEQLAKDIEDKTGIESRATVLGHVQRGGSPTLRDRVVASEMGYKAVELLVQGKSNRVVAMRHGDIVDFDITEALQMKKQFNKELYDIALKISI